jgi:hypothetical protein
MASCGASEAPPQSQSAPQTAPAVGSAWFADVTEAWGLDFAHDAGLSPEKHLPETMAAGAALFDADEDGDLDVYLVQSGPMPLGGPEPGTFVPAPGPKPVNRLFLNEGDGRLRDATEASGDAAHDGYGMGVACGDANGDGHLDLYVTNLGDDVLLFGDGDARFADRTQESGIADSRWTSCATFFDAEGDGDLDLYVCAYLLVDLAHPLWCGAREPGWRSACHPDAYAGLPDRFWLNQGDGRFVDATQAAGLSDSPGKALGVVAQDFDGDGDLDLYTANDSVESRYWENLGGGHFRDSTLLSGTGVDERGATEAGMGLAVGDVDGDLDLDLFKTGFDRESDTLYVNEGGGIFSDRTVAAGLEVPTRLPVGWGAALEDFDHDGDLDLAVVNGHIIDNIHLYHDGQTHAQRAGLFENDGRGRFRELSPERAGALTAEPWVGRGLYAGDLDRDGDLDLLVTQCGGPARILRNDAAHEPALIVQGLPDGTQLVATLADGSKLLRTSGAQTSYFGASAPMAHFGVDPAQVTALEIRVAYRAPVTLDAGDLPRPLPALLRLAPAGDSWRPR